MDFSTNTTFAKINAALLERGEDFLAWLLPGGHASGQEWVCGSIAGEPGRSLSANMTTGVWKDFGTGESGRDLVSLYAAVENVRQSEALRACRKWMGGNDNERPAEKKKDDDWWKGEPSDKIWEYRDAKGGLVCQVKRWDARPEEGHKKVIRPWVFFDKAQTNGDYRMPDRDDRPLLYLQEIMAGTAPVILVAGEKCADAVRALGYVGTTFMGGESAMNRTDFSPLTDREIVLWADHDPTGDAWAQKLIEKLREVEARSIRVIEVPANTPPKWDAADADEATRRELIEKSLDAPPMIRSVTFWRMDELTEGEPPERDWLVTGAVARKMASIIVGPGGCGKSISVLDLCLKIATADRYGAVGCPPPSFLGPVPVPAAGPAIFLTLEDDKDELNRRMRNLDPGETHKGAPLYVIPGLDIEGFDPTLIRQEGRLPVFTKLAESGLPRILERVGRVAGRAPVFLALDPAGDLLEGSEDDAAVVKPLMRYLRELAVRFDIGVLLVAHDAKGQKDADIVKTRGARGSKAFTDNSRFGWGLWRPTMAQTQRVLRNLGLDVTEKNIERVVQGTKIKANFNCTLTGVRTYLQSPNSGLLEDCTQQIQTSDEKEEYVVDQVVLGIKTAAEQGRPFCQTGEAYGIAFHRDKLPPGPLRDSERYSQFNNNWLTKIIDELATKKRIVRVAKWYDRKKVLDIPGGPVDRVGNNGEVLKEPVTPRNSWDYVYPEDDE